jgi:hypothetical protein
MRVGRLRLTLHFKSDHSIQLIVLTDLANVICFGVHFMASVSARENSVMENVEAGRRLVQVLPNKDSAWRTISFSGSSAPLNQNAPVQR